MTETTPTLDLVPATEDIVSIATDVWSSLNLDLDQTEQFLDEASITGSASVSISGTWEGIVRLDFTTELPGVLAAAMFMMEPADVTDDEVADAVGELANMLGGNLKSLLPEHSRLSLPAVVLGSTVTLRVTGATLVRRVDFTCGGRALRVTLWESSKSVADR
jgi:chemotaxis protein CheX